MKRNLIEPVLGFCLLGIVILAVKYGSIHVTGSTDAYIKEMPVVVIDAGHGGTDRGKSVLTEAWRKTSTWLLQNG